VETNAFAFYEDGNIKPPNVVEFCNAKYSYKKSARFVSTMCIKSEGKVVPFSAVNV
jgi:hypothetical protein